MLLPVIERFAELGWRAFVEPGETYELFSVSGIFKRVHVDTTAGDSSSADAAQQQIAQRHALFDVCLGSGLAHLIVAYVSASESDSSSSCSSVNHDGKRYVLKEPVAVQQWLRRRVDGLEKTVHADVSALAHARDGLDATSAASTPTDHHHHNRMHRKGSHKPSDVESFMRELSGLRAVAMALVERLQESAYQLEANALALRSLPPSMASQRREDLLQQTELARLTNEGIQQLLELLFRAQAATLTCQCLLWFKEHHVVFDADQYHEFYYQARSARASLRQSFEGSYDVVLSSVSNSDIAFPSLLIEMVHQNASVAEQLSLPPGGVSDLFSLLQAPAIPAEMVQSFAREIRLAPVESFFRVQTAMLLYFALDLAYVSLTQRPSHQHHAWMGQELVDHFVDIAASFAAQMGVPDDMAATLLAIWLIENAVNIKLSSNEEVGPIYQGAVTRLLESSAMHLQHKGAGLEPELILYMVETLVHRGESSIAWKIWTAFDMDLAKLPPVATEYAVMVNLELTAWERALSLLREQRRLDLLPLVLKWLVKNNRMKELVHYATLTAQEEELFDEFMMGGRVLGEDVLLEMSIRKADLLVMYYVLRNHFDRAWAVHHEHLAQIRESTSGHTSVAHAVLHQQSFRIRTALLQTMKPEPTSQEPTYNFKRNMQVTRPVDTDVMMIGSSSNLPLLQLPEMSASEDERMSDEFTTASSMPLPLPPPAPADSTPLRRRETSNADASPASSPAPTPFAYSPGIFSSRSSQPRSASSSLAGEATPTGAQTTSRRNVLIGSIDSSPPTASSSSGPLRRHSDDASSAKRVTQTLNFGLSPVVPHGNTSGNPTPSSEHGKASSDQPRAFVLQPVRSPFNSAFSTLPSMPSASSSGSEDLSLRPRSESAANPAPVDVQVGSSSGLAPAAATTADGSQLPSTIATAASTATQDLTLFATPKRFQFVREPPKTDSRVVVANRSHDAAALRSPATQELEAMELEPIDEEFSTPAARSGRAQALARKEPQSVPTRRNPRRNTRSLY